MIAKQLRHARAPLRFAALIVAVGLLFGAPNSAQARDMTGKGGVGLLVTTAGMPMLAFRYWRTNAALEGLIGYVATTPTPATADHPDTTQVRLALGFLYRLHDAAKSSLSLGLRPWLQYTLASSPTEKDQSQWRFGAEIPLQGEVFLNDHFSLIGHVGLTFDFAPPQARADGNATSLDALKDSTLVIGMRGGFSGGAGVTYYF